MGKLYTVLRGTCRVVMPKMRAEWAVPFDGQPSVFCPNHAGAFGPIDMCVFFPLSDHCHPWLNAAVMDPKLVPAYVRQDYWWRPGCRLERYSFPPRPRKYVPCSARRCRKRKRNWFAAGWNGSWNVRMILS